MDAGIIDFISPMGSMLCSVVVLVLLTSWGQQKLAEVEEEGLRTKDALTKIEEIFEEVSKSALVLKDKSGYCDEQMQLEKEHSISTSNSLRELAISVEAAATTVANISKSSSISKESTDDVYGVMNDINQYFNDTLSDVTHCKARCRGELSYN